MSAVVEGEPLTGEVVAEQPECGFNVLDFSDSYYEDKDAVAISFRIVVREKFMWIWIGDAPMLTNSSVHVSNAPTGVSTTRLIEEDEHGDFGTLLGGRLSKKLSNHIVHVNYALTPGMSVCLSTV